MDKKTVGVTGSTNIKSYSDVRHAVEDSVGLHNVDGIVTRNDEGADKRARNLAEREDLKLTVEHADWAENDSLAGVYANENIVAQSDHLIVVWDGESSKARNAIEKAIFLDVPFSVECTATEDDSPIVNSLERTQLMNRLPELSMINDDDVREETIRTFIRLCPDYFWDTPSSSTGKYHPFDESGIYGNWLHTKRAFVHLERLLRSATEMETVNDFEADCTRSAILMHDMFKYGFPPANMENTISEDDIVCAGVIKNLTDLPEEVVNCVLKHNGGWSPEHPTDEYEKIHHYADMVASNRDGGAVYGPSPELKGLGESVRGVREQHPRYTEYVINTSAEEHEE